MLQKETGNDYEIKSGQFGICFADVFPLKRLLLNLGFIFALIGKDGRH